MKRKLIELGKGSLVVNIPYQFVKKNNLQKGHEIEIEEINDKELKVKANPDEEKPIKRISLTIKNKEEFMQRLIHRQYVSGFDEITIHFGDAALITAIEDVVESLIGFEIVELSEDKCVIKSLSKDNEGGFDVVLRRLFLLLLNTAEESVKIIRNNYYSKLEVIKKFRMTTNKYSYFCERLLNKNSTIADAQKIELSFAIWGLEQVADNFKFIWDNLSASKTQIKKDLEDYYILIVRILREYYETYYSRKKEDIQSLRKLFFENFEKDAELKDKVSKIVYSHLKIIENILFHLQALILPKQIDNQVSK